MCSMFGGRNLAIGKNKFRGFWTKNVSFCCQTPSFMIIIRLLRLKVMPGGLQKSIQRGSSLNVTFSFYYSVYVFFLNFSLSFSDASQKVSSSLGPKGQNLSRDVTVKAREGAPDTPDAYFESSPPQNVSALMGKTAFLTCVVRNLGKAKSVSSVSVRLVHIFYWLINLGHLARGGYISYPWGWWGPTELAILVN